MCGIAGIYRFRDGPPLRPDAVAPALALMVHRGPDAEGVHATDRCVMGCRRLAVIDREGGAQPMATEDGRHVLVYNGEIHDFEEHRDRLEAEGVTFRSRSDTEVLLRLLAGRDHFDAFPLKPGGVLEEVTGMFAFALHDVETGIFVLARDAFGVKPLLVAREGGEVRFASELPALLALSPESPRLDLEALVERIAFQVPLFGESLVRDVRHLAPGSVRTSAPGCSGRFPRGGDWAESGSPRPGLGEVRWVERLRDALRRAVRICLRSDVPVGVTLSGGLDSSLVAALAAREGLPVTAYTGYFEEGEVFDERAHARRAAQEIGIDLVEVPVTPRDLLDRLRDLAVMLEGPIAGPGSLPQLVVAERAAADVTVLLTGQGADETFGGYARHRILWLASRGELAPDRLPGDLAAYAPLVAHLRAGQRAGASVAELFFRLVHRGEGVEPLLGPALRDAFHEYDAPGEFRRVFDRSGDPMEDVLGFERRTLLPALLHVEDRVTMAHSLESRVPLLDREVVRIAEEIPAELHFGRGEGKRVLREAARGIAPDCAVDRRDKMGFPVPLARWARGPLNAALRERLEDGPLVREGILAPGAPETLLARGDGHGRHLWFFLLLSEWMDATGIRP